MLSGLLLKLQEVLTRRHHNEDEIQFSCERCGAKIESLTESPHLRRESELLFFCSERCFARFTQYRLNKQARWAVKLLKKMQRIDRTIVPIATHSITGLDGNQDTAPTQEVVEEAKTPIIAFVGLERRDSSSTT